MHAQPNSDRVKPKLGTIVIIETNKTEKKALLVMSYGKETPGVRC